MPYLPGWSRNLPLGSLGLAHPHPSLTPTPPRQWSQETPDRTVSTIPHLTPGYSGSMISTEGHLAMSFYWLWLTWKARGYPHAQGEDEAPVTLKGG